MESFLLQPRRKRRRNSLTRSSLVRVVTYHLCLKVIKRDCNKCSSIWSKTLSSLQGRAGSRSTLPSTMKETYSECTCRTQAGASKAPTKKGSSCLTLSCKTTLTKTAQKRRAASEWASTSASRSLSKVVAPLMSLLRASVWARPSPSAWRWIRVRPSETDYGAEMPYQKSSTLQTITMSSLCATCLPRATTSRGRLARQTWRITRLTKTRQSAQVRSKSRSRKSSAKSLSLGRAKWSAKCLVPGANSSLTNSRSLSWTTARRSSSVSLKTLSLTMKSWLRLTRTRIRLHAWMSQTLLLSALAKRAIWLVQKMQKMRIQITWRSSSNWKLRSVRYCPLSTYCVRLRASLTMRKYWSLMTTRSIRSRFYQCFNNSNLRQT